MKKYIPLAFLLLPTINCYAMHPNIVRVQVPLGYSSYLGGGSGSGSSGTGGGGSNVTPEIPVPPSSNCFFDLDVGSYTVEYLQSNSLPSGIMGGDKFIYYNGKLIGAQQPHLSRAFPSGLSSGEMQLTDGATFNAYKACADNPSSYPEIELTPLISEDVGTFSAGTDTRYNPHGYEIVMNGVYRVDNGINIGTPGVLPGGYRFMPYSQQNSQKPGVYENGFYITNGPSISTVGGGTAAMKTWVEQFKKITFTKPGGEIYSMNISGIAGGIGDSNWIWIGELNVNSSAFFNFLGNSSGVNVTFSNR